jgi:hypothetical protein
MKATCHLVTEGERLLLLLPCFCFTYGDWQKQRAQKLHLRKVAVIFDESHSCHFLAFASP